MDIYGQGEQAMEKTMEQTMASEDMKLRALSVYFQYWGQEELKKQIQQKGQAVTCRVIRKEYLYCVTPHRMSHYKDEVSKAIFFRRLMFEGDSPESVFMKLKELGEALLESTPYIPSGCVEGYEYHNPRFLEKMYRVVGKHKKTPFCFYSEKQKASLWRVDAILSFIN
jgi:hypothetical protein